MTRDRTTRPEWRLAKSRPQSGRDEEPDETHCSSERERRSDPTHCSHVCLPRSEVPTVPRVIPRGQGSTADSVKTSKSTRHREVKP